MKRALMYGAGNIGRGFIGALFAQSGYQVTFVDVAPDVVRLLHERGQYPVRIVRSEGHTDLTVANVDAINGNDAAAVARAVAEADIMATAVGVNVLKFIAPNIAAGVRLRKDMGNGPLDILICENLLDANLMLAGLIKAHLSEEERAWFDERIGMVEASIGRMVPVQTEQMKDGEPLRVCVEEYAFLPVDKAAFKNAPPPIEGLVPYAPFDYYIRRKLFVHNMGHAVLAYLGAYAGLQYIWEAAGDVTMRLIAENAMLESAQALSKAFGEPIGPLIAHAQDLIRRFGNRALMDTCGRVGGDPKRKLGANDRLTGAAKNCLEQGVAPVCICVGAAGAVFEYLRGAGAEQTRAHALETLANIAGLAEDDPLTQIILPLYGLFAAGEPVPAILRAADETRARLQGGAI